MNHADLPTKNASEPIEEARQPQSDDKMLPNKPRKITFAQDVDFSQNSSSQQSCSNKEALSQPPNEMSHYEKLLWLQQRRGTGLWVQCDECDKWRYMPNILDKHELPDKWYCRLNTDEQYSSCSIPEVPLRVCDEEDLIHSSYSVGSLVWARVKGWPWWPAMVDDCPDTQLFYWIDGYSDIPTYYHVVFFDKGEVTRAWISSKNVKPYAVNKSFSKYLNKNMKYTLRLKAAMSQADEACEMPLEPRLKTFSFIARYKDVIKSPKKIAKKHKKKFEKDFKNKYNVEIQIDSSESEDDCSFVAKKSVDEFNNLIIFGSPKTPKHLKTNKKAKASNTPATNTIEDVQDMRETQPVKDNETGNTDKINNSMNVQVGNTEPESAMDCDSSKTYLPSLPSESVKPTQPTMFSIRTDDETPNSDDFDF